MAGPSKKLPFYLDRRNYARRTVIESRLISVELGERSRGVLIDVGEGGVAVQPFVPLPVGAESDVYFETPGGTRVKAHGLVAWVGENGRTGIRFTEVEPQTREEIRRWAEADGEREGEDKLESVAHYAELPSRPEPPAHEAEAATHEPQSPEPRSTLSPGGQQADGGEAGADQTRATLEAIAQRALLVTDADGAAIAMWQADAVRCSASVGRAPTIGVSVTPGHGIAGQCLLAARPMLCCNARSHARVVQDAALVLNMGSCAMVPVIKNDAAIGLIAVFSIKPVAFDETHLAALEELAATLG